MKDLAEQNLNWEEIVSTAVHDMRTPLSCMNTALEVLRMVSAGSEKHGRLIKILETQVTHLSQQMETLLKNPQSFAEERIKAR